MKGFSVAVIRNNTVSHLRLGCCIMKELGVTSDSSPVLYKLDTNCQLLNIKLATDDSTNKQKDEWIESIIQHSISCPARESTTFVSSAPTTDSFETLRATQDAVKTCCGDGKCGNSGGASGKSDGIAGECVKSMVGAAVCLVLESSDGQILLTQRAAHMRTFPGVWVPPGGHIDEGESIWSAAMRELHEETGLSLRQKCPVESCDTLGLWESVYPAYLARGSPRRQHVVVYLHSVAPYSSHWLKQNIKIDLSEVQSFAFLSRKKAALCLATFAVRTSSGISINADEVSSTVADDDENVQPASVYDSAQCSPDVKDRENLSSSSSSHSGSVTPYNVTSGTQFAVHQWLKSSRSRL